MAFTVSGLYLQSVLLQRNARAKHPLVFDKPGTQ